METKIKPWVESQSIPLYRCGRCNRPIALVKSNDKRDRCLFCGCLIDWEERKVLNMKKGEKYIVEVAEVVKDENGEVARIKGFDSLFMSPRGLEKLEKYKEPENRDDSFIDVNDIVNYPAVSSERYGVVTLKYPNGICSVLWENGDTSWVCSSELNYAGCSYDVKEYILSSIKAIGDALRSPGEG